MISKEKRKAKIISLLLKKDMKWNEIKKATGSPKSTLHGDLEDLKNEEIIEKNNKEPETIYSVVKDNIHDINYIKEYGEEILPQLKTQREILEWLNSNPNLTINSLIQHANNHKNYYNIKNKLEAPLTIDEIIRILKKISQISPNVGEELNSYRFEINIDGDFQNILEKNEYHLECARNLDRKVHLD